MIDLFAILAVFALLATVSVLLWGVGSMARGGSYDTQHSERLMYARVALQAFAVLCVLLVVYVIAF